MALALPAAAQNYRQITAKELHQNASRHLKQRIELKDAYCYSLEDNGGYECGTGETLTIRAKDMAEGPLKAKIEAECGGLDAIEQTPNCRTNVRFIATAVSKEPGRGDARRQADAGRNHHRHARIHSTPVAAR